MTDWPAEKASIIAEAFKEKFVMREVQGCYFIVNLKPTDDVSPYVHAWPPHPIRGTFPSIKEFDYSWRSENPQPDEISKRLEEAHEQWIAARTLAIADALASGAY